MADSGLTPGSSPVPVFNPRGGCGGGTSEQGPPAARPRLAPTGSPSPSTGSPGAGTLGRRTVSDETTTRPTSRGLCGAGGGRWLGDLDSPQSPTPEPPRPDWDLPGTCRSPPGARARSRPHPASRTDSSPDRIRSCTGDLRGGPSASRNSVGEWGVSASSYLPREGREGRCCPQRAQGRATQEGTAGPRRRAGSWGRHLPSGRETAPRPCPRRRPCGSRSSTAHPGPPCRVAPAPAWRHVRLGTRRELGGSAVRGLASSSTETCFPARLAWACAGRAPLPRGSECAPELVNGGSRRAAGPTCKRKRGVKGAADGAAGPGPGAGVLR